MMKSVNEINAIPSVTLLSRNYNIISTACWKKL